MVQRKQKVAAELARVVSQLVQEEIDEPGMGFITFLGADVSPDLRNAIVTYSVMGSDEDKDRTDAILQAETGFIKKRVNQKIRLRYAIDVTLKRSEDIDHSFRVQEILDKIAKEKKNRD